MYMDQDAATLADEYYGRGVNGMDYYRCGDEIYRTLNEYTSWVCTVVCWELSAGCRRYHMGG